MSTQAWQNWLAEQRAQSQMTARQVDLEAIENGGWIKTLYNNFSSISRLGPQDRPTFLSVIGIFVSGARRGVQAWYQPAIKMHGHGIIVLPTNAEGTKFLVRAAEHGGNPDVHDGKKYARVLLAPALQASAGNWQGEHGSSRPPGAVWHDKCKQADWVMSWKDGARYLESFNLLATPVVDLDAYQCEPDERVFTAEELNAAYLSGDCNEHMGNLIALAAATSERRRAHG